jgi:hypothetical protein
MQCGVTGGTSGAGNGGDLVDPDPSQAGELVELLLSVVPDPGDDGPDCASRDPHQHGDRGLRRLCGSHPTWSSKNKVVTTLMSGPRDSGDGDAVDRASDTGRGCF